MKTKGSLHRPHLRRYVGTKCCEIETHPEGRKALTELNPDQRCMLRSDLYLSAESLGKLVKQHKLEDPAEVRRRVHAQIADG